MPSLAPLADIASYHADAEASLKLFFSSANPGYETRFAAYFQSDVNTELTERLSETDVRSSLITLARVEAALRIDYRQRCRHKMADDVSLTFRRIFKQRRERARLDEDILEAWSNNVHPCDRAVIRQLRGMFKFRHWLAHGRHWNFGQHYMFQDVYFVADAVMTGLPLES